MENKPVQSAANNGKKIIKGWPLWLAAIFSMAFLVNCHWEYDDDYDSPLTYETHIVSDQDADGDIAFSLPGNYTVAFAGDTGSVLAGIDPDDGDEYRGFLTFPVRGFQAVPLYADIESATLEIYINSVVVSSPGAGVPLLFDLVSFSPPLIPSDFDSAPLLTLYSNIVFADDAGYFLTFDVTPLMVEAQRRNLTNFQIRILLDSTPASSGLIEIEDSILETAPLLAVTYY